MAKRQTEAPEGGARGLLARLMGRAAAKAVDAHERFCELAEQLARGDVPKVEEVEQVLAAAGRTPEQLQELVELHERAAELRARQRPEAELRATFDRAAVELREAVAERDRVLRETAARVDAAQHALDAARRDRDRAATLARELTEAEDLLDGRRFGGAYVAAQQQARRDERRAQHLPQQLEHRIAQVRRELSAFRGGNAEHPNVVRAARELRDLERAVPAVRAALLRGDCAAALEAAAVRPWTVDDTPAPTTPHPVFDDAAKAVAGEQPQAWVAGGVA